MENSIEVLKRSWKNCRRYIKSGLSLSNITSNISIMSEYNKKTVTIVFHSPSPCPLAQMCNFFRSTILINSLKQMSGITCLYIFLCRVTKCLENQTECHNSHVNKICGKELFPEIYGEKWDELKDSRKKVSQTIPFSPSFFCNP